MGLLPQQTRMTPYIVSVSASYKQLINASLHVSAGVDPLVDRAVPWESKAPSPIVDGSSTTNIRLVTPC